MNKILLATILILSPLSFLYSQIIDREFPDQKGNIKLLGNTSYERLNKTPFKDWYSVNESTYNPAEVDITDLKSSFNKVDSITVFMGTWCGDSKREVPKLTQTLKSLDFDFSKLKIVCLDNKFNNYKQSPENEQAGNNIHRIPTIILHNNNEELGRIVERPVTSIEKDLKAITEGSYTPNYQGVNILDSHIDNKGINWLKKNEVSILEELKPIVSRYSELATYGRVLLSSWKIQEAVTVFELNTKLYPDAEYVHIQLANAYLLLGEYEKTEECCSRALKINPDSKMAANLLSKIK